MAFDLFIEVRPSNTSEILDVVERLRSAKAPNAENALKNYKTVGVNSKILCKDVDNVICAVYRDEIENPELYKIREELLVTQSNIQMYIIVSVHFPAYREEFRKIMRERRYSSSDDIKLLLNAYNLMLDSGMEPNIILANKLCALYKKLDQPDKALNLAESIPEHRKHSYFTNTVASCFNSVQKWQEALNEIDKIPREHQTSYHAHTKAIALMGLGRLEEAHGIVLKIPVKDRHENKYINNTILKIAKILEKQGKI